MTITETAFTRDGIRYTLVDTSAEKLERKEWIRAVQDSTAAIFVSSLSDCFSTQLEDTNANGMQESLQLFGEICNSLWFKDSFIILFLNKRDIFREKITKINFSTCFEDANGIVEYDQAIQFISRKFLLLNKDQTKIIYIHVICAVDYQVMENTFNSVKDIVLRPCMGGADML